MLLARYSSYHHLHAYIYRQVTQSGQKGVKYQSFKLIDDNYFLVIIIQLAAWVATYSCYHVAHVLRL